MMFVTKNPWTVLFARPIMLKTQSDAIFARKVKQEECSCTHPVH